MHRIGLAALLVVLALSLAACTAAPRQPDAGNTPSPTPTQTPDTTATPGDDPAAGLRLAPGLYDMPDGKAQALGTLGYRDIEGGFWVIIDGTQPEGDKDAVVAVIANGDEFQRQLEPLKGKQVTVVGTKVDGASIRMAGPEIEIESVEEITDTPGIAE